MRSMDQLVCTLVWWFWHYCNKGFQEPAILSMRNLDTFLETVRTHSTWWSQDYPNMGELHFMGGGDAGDAIGRDGNSVPKDRNSKPPMIINDPDPSVFSRDSSWTSENARAANTVIITAGAVTAGASAWDFYRDRKLGQQNIPKSHPSRQNLRINGGWKAALAGVIFPKISSAIENQFKK